MNHENDLIREYATFLFENDYSLYTAKQWGVSAKEIDSSVLKRVPIRFNYEIGYFDDDYQVMPRASYTEFFVNLLDDKRITVSLNSDAMSRLELDMEQRVIKFDGEVFEGPVIYTGAIDELFGYNLGLLPYRSLEFKWMTEAKESFQEAPVVAYPQAEGFTRITEYTKLPVQQLGNVTSYAIEYPIPYTVGVKVEPYYPVLTEASQKLYALYEAEARTFKNLYLCGRLADFKYYNMDQALEKALIICKELEK